MFFWQKEMISNISYWRRGIISNISCWQREIISNISGWQREIIQILVSQSSACSNPLFDSCTAHDDSSALWRFRITCPALYSVLHFSGTMSPGSFFTLYRNLFSFLFFVTTAVTSRELVWNFGVTVAFFLGLAAPKSFDETSKSGINTTDLTVVRSISSAVIEA